MKPCSTVLSSQICAHETRQLALGTIVLVTNESHPSFLLDKRHTLHKELVCICIETTIGSAVAPRRQQHVERDILVGGVEARDIASGIVRERTRIAAARGAKQLLMLRRGHGKQQETNAGVKVLDEAKVDLAQALDRVLDNTCTETKRLLIVTESQLRLPIRVECKRRGSVVLFSDR